MIVEDKAARYTGTKGIPFGKAGQTERNTGDWRVFKPIVHLEECIACMMCWVSCPENAISVDKDDYPTIDYNICKGCLICEQVCPKKGKAITHVRDTHEG